MLWVTRIVVKRIFKKNEHKIAFFLHILKKCSIFAAD